MASFRKRNNKWEARVRRQGNKTICKTFTNIEDAKRWAREQELQEFKKKLQVEKLGEEIFNNQRTDN